MMPNTLLCAMHRPTPRMSQPSRQYQDPCYLMSCIGQLHSCVILTGSGKDDEEDADIAAQLGVGSLAADVELDALKDAGEGEILGMHNLLARYAPLLAALCHNRCSWPAAHLLGICLCNLQSGPLQGSAISQQSRCLVESYSTLNCYLLRAEPTPAVC